MKITISKCDSKTMTEQLVVIVPSDGSVGSKSKGFDKSNGSGKSIGSVRSNGCIT